ncbi:MAG: hypothetical protein EOL98_15345 [Negativicutes bacterium]|nr:hypothetical protein [Negativicutes bacterium]
MLLIDVIEALNSYGCVIHESSDTEELKRRVIRRVDKIKDDDDDDGVPYHEQQKTIVAKEIATRNGLEISLQEKRYRLIMMYESSGIADAWLKVREELIQRRKRLDLKDISRHEDGKH